MSPTRHECRQVPCSRATYCRHNNDDGSIFPHHFWRVPQLFLMTSLKGIAYACDISPPFGRIHPSAFNESQEGETRRTSFRRNPMSSGFNESDKGRTRRLFMFREFEKTAEKKTPQVPFRTQFPRSEKVENNIRENLLVAIGQGIPFRNQSSPARKRVKLILGECRFVSILMRSKRQGPRQYFHVQRVRKELKGDSSWRNEWY